MQGFDSSLRTTIATAARVRGAGDAMRWNRSRWLAMTPRNIARRGSTGCPSTSRSAARTILLWIVERAHGFSFGLLTDFSGGAQKTRRINSSEIS
jgi:hypothetical protein